MRSHVVAVVILFVALAANGCTTSAAANASEATAGGNPVRGRELIEHVECGNCHMIPGVRTARGVSASPLTWFARRSFIAGEVPNTPDNLVRWLENPRSIEPRTAMPSVGMTESQARDVAAYLYSLR
jgi:cytochrome c2